MPGLFFKYDVSALKVIVKPDQEGFMHFLIRISSVIAGIIVISGKTKCALKYFQLVFLHLIIFLGYLNSFIQLIIEFFIRKVSPQTYQQLHNPTLNINNFDEKPQGLEQPQAQPNWQQQPNNLISNANQMAEANFNFTVTQ